MKTLRLRAGMVVEHSEASEILCCLHVKDVGCHRFMHAGRSHEMSRSKIKNSLKITVTIIVRVSAFLFFF